MLVYNQIKEIIIFLRESAMTESIAYFLTWTAYGSWLPGDSRGWVKWHHGFQDPNPKFEEYARSKLIEPVCQLSKQECRIVEEEIQALCQNRGWFLHAVNCRMSHVHAVVSAAGIKPEIILSQLKASCTRKLMEGSVRIPLRTRWWAEGGCKRSICDEKTLHKVIDYILYRQ
jgi:hypothetical protein